MPTEIRYAFGYARVSSEEQKKEGYSIPSQVRTIERYAGDQGYQLIRVFEEVESAKQAGRRSFEELFKILKSYKQNCPVLLVEKPDRLTRNWADKALIEGLIDSHGLEIHYIKENNVLRNDSPATAYAMADMSAMISRFYIKNLQAETKKGQLEKAERGIYPSRASFGYLNIERNGEKIVEAHPFMGPFVSKLFEWYATGNFGTGELTEKAVRHGRGIEGMPKQLHRSQVYRLLRNPFYTGVFIWKGRTYPGKHPALVSPHTFNRVQELMIANGHNRPHRRTYQWLFQGMVRCGVCGCLLTAERHTKAAKTSDLVYTWVYYRCTGAKGKHPFKYVREEELGRQFAEALNALQLDEKTFDMMVRTLRHSQDAEHHVYTDKLEKLEVYLKQLDERIQNAFELAIDQRFDGARFKTMLAKWEAEQKRTTAEIVQLRADNSSRLEDAITIIELAQHAGTIYDSCDMEQKREFIRFVASNQSWHDGRLIVEYKKPFSTLALMGAADHKKSAAITEDNGAVLNGSGGRI